MTTKITLWGTARPDLRRPPGDPGLPARHGADPRRATSAGWNVRYTTELTEPPWFYLRGEEYSAQLDAFVQRVAAPATPTGRTTSPRAAVTDRVIAMISDDAAREVPVDAQTATDAGARAASGQHAGEAPASHAAEHRADSAPSQEATSDAATTERA